MVKPMENVPLYSGLIRLKLMMKAEAWPWRHHTF